MHFWGLEKHKKKYDIFICIIGVLFVLNIGYTVMHKDKYRAKSIPGANNESIDFVQTPMTVGEKSIENNEIKFKDANLEHIIRFNLNKLDKKILVKDVRRISYLNLNHCDIVNLEGLEYFSNLRKLDLSFNDIKVVTFLTKLTHLQDLIINNNKISDLSEIAKIPSLRTLDISSNEISDLNPITALVNLKELDLNDNKIVDVSALNQLSGLSSLDISRNDIKDISSIKGQHYKLFLDWGNKIK
jgi:internalin A